MRALTREVGSLKEDLRREVKRRERANISSREAEELKQEAEKRVKQLEYSKRSDNLRFTKRILQVGVVLTQSAYQQEAGTGELHCSGGVQGHCSQEQSSCNNCPVLSCYVPLFYKYDAPSIVCSST